MAYLHALSQLHFVVLIEWVLRLAGLFILPYRRKEATARSWLLLIFFSPWIGWVLFFLFGSSKMPQWRLQRRQKYRELLQPNLPLPAVPEVENATSLLVRRLGTLPVTPGNRLDLLTDYDGTIESLIRDIDGAKHHVHLLFYIFADDATGNRVAEALARAVKRGVKCRVLMDAMGSFGARKKLVPRLKETGVDVRAVLRLRDLRQAARVDLRNHRKIVVIDGRIGYTGSQNIVNADFKPHIVYEELVARIEGQAVLQLQAVFAADWYAETEEAIIEGSYFPRGARAGESAVQILPSDPGFPYPSLLHLLTDLIHEARYRVEITTPYFVPDDSLLQAMQTAVLQGVEVHLVVSEIIDQLMVGYAQRSYYEDLLDAGVRIYHYRERFLHAKHFSIDDRVAGLGSSNMDIRSFHLNAEVTVLSYDPLVAKALQREQARYMAGSTEITPHDWRVRPRIAKFRENLARLISPLL